MIDNKIEEKIHSFVDKCHKEPNQIILHPNTLSDLITIISEKITNFSKIEINNGNDFRYLGIKIIRSLDVPENYVIVGFVV